MTTFQYKHLPDPEKLFVIDTESIEREKTAIHFYAGADSMLSVKEDGFYVRGVRIEQDADEARKVHESFVAWLTWAQLNKA